MTVTYTQLGKTGRMGNQLFELSASIGLAARNNDTYVFPPWEHEQDFNLHNCFSNNIRITHSYNEPFFHYKEINTRNTRSQVCDLIGYFQSYKYFEHIKEKIVQLFTPVHHFEKEPGLCSLHVRRGDYLNFQDCHPTMAMDYYQRAMEKSGSNKFLIFSDDINWCKSNFTGNMFEFSEGHSPAVDLAMMAKKCENNIICNSSFSWWGAYLNQTSTKIVLAPQQWFGSKLAHHQTQDLLPTSWMKI